MANCNLEANQVLFYNLEEVRIEYQLGLCHKPFTPKHCWFVNLGYSMARNLNSANWTFDLTTQWYCKQRIPITKGNPLENQREGSSLAFYRLNGQLSRNFNSKWIVYASVENILNYCQEDPIISAENPFKNNFDASMVW